MGRLTPTEALLIKRVIIGVLLLALIGWVFYPTRKTAAQELPLVFNTTGTLNKNQNEYPGPRQSEIPKQNTRPKVIGVKTTKQNRLSSGRYTTATKFAPGQCTDYVARRVRVTWRGNANRWIQNSRAQGYKVDFQPEVGAILITNESRFGHVTYIENVVGTKITISEWNYKGKYITSYRTFDISSSKIKGIIHVN